MSKLTKKDRQQLSDLYSCIDNEGVSYYFTNYYTVEDERILKKAGFNTSAIEDALSGVDILDEVFTELEQYSEDT